MSNSTLYPGRDGRGRFTPGNPHASHGGRRRAEVLDPDRRSEIARAGFDAMVATHFAGDAQAAAAWLGELGAWANDRGYAALGMGKFAHPGDPAAYRRTR